MAPLSLVSRPVGILSILLAAFSSTIVGQTILVRGTLLCRPEGKVGYERPLQSEYAIVVPIGYPKYASIVAQDGVFDLALPSENTFFDRVLPIQCQVNGRSIGQFSVFVSKARVQRRSGIWLFEMQEPVVVSGDCDSLPQDLALAQEELARICAGDEERSTHGILRGSTQTQIRALMEEGPGETRVTITGNVIDASGRPAHNVTISLNAIHFRAVTDEEGDFRGVIRKRRLGERLVLVVSHPGYHSVRLEHVVTSTEENFGTITLHTTD